MKRTAMKITNCTLHAAIVLPVVFSTSTTAAPETLGIERQELDLEAVLDAAKRAAKRDSWGELEDGLHLQGTTDTGGVEGSFELFLAPDGRYRYEQGGRLARRVSFDGQRLSTRVRKGPANLLEQGDRDPWHYSQWLQGGFWLDPACPLDIELIGQSPDEITLQLSLPDSPTPGHLSLDRGSWLPKELRRESLGGETVLRFQDYEEVAGVPLARVVVNEAHGEEGVLRVRDARPAAADPGDRYEHDLSPPSDVHFDDESGPSVELKRAVSGHLLVHPLVEGQDVGWFILDTGAGQVCIDPKVAEALELEEFGSVPAVGVAGAVRASYRQGTTLELGPMSIDDPVYVEIDLAFLSPIFGVEVAGICGYEIFARAIVSLDLEEPSLALHSPGALRLDEDAWSPLILGSRVPSVRCRFEGDREGLFKLDLGDSGTISFYSPAVRSLGLLDGRAVEASQVGGVGGTGAAVTGTLEWFELGGHRVEALPVTFSQAESGVFSSAHALGNLGSEMLKPFQVVFDYPNARIALLPRE